MSARKPFHIGAWTAAGCLMLPFLYVLSIGVLIRIESRGQLQEPLLEAAIIYAAPYNWVCDRLPQRYKPVVDAFERVCGN